MHCRDRDADERLGSAMIIHSNNLNSVPEACEDCGPSDADLSTSKPTSLRTTLNPRSSPPFILSNDLSRAVMHIVQSLIGFAFMLCIM